MRKRRSSVDSTTLDKFGRVLLPKPVREKLGLQPGDSLDVKVEEGSLVLRRHVKAKPGIAYRNGVPYLTGYELPPGFDIMEFIHRQREERIRKKAGPWKK